MTHLFISSTAFSSCSEALIAVICRFLALVSRFGVFATVNLHGGPRAWGVGAKNEEEDLIKVEAKAKRKIEGKKKAKETREKNKA